MNVAPVIARELRSQATQPFTYWLRTLGVSVLLVTATLLLLTGSFTGGHGLQLFLVFHRVLLGAIAILIPLGVADCISHERRAGTLGLLFLTPLRARDIVLAKATVHLARAFTLWLASLPIQALPFLIGGVSWPIAAASALINFWVILFAVSVSILASTFCRNAQRAAGLAFVLGSGGVVVLSYIVPVLALLAFGVTTLLLKQTGPPWLWNGYRDFFSNWLDLIMSPAQCWEIFFGCLLGDEFLSLRQTSRWLRPVWFGFLAALVVIVICLGLAVWLLHCLAVRRLKLCWQESAPSARMQKLDANLKRPVFGNQWLRRWLRWRLDRNPIGWLEQRNWTGRLIVWIWLGVVVLVYSQVLAATRSLRYDYNMIHAVLGGLLGLSIAATAAGSFRRERESGVLELLLVSPLTEEQIVWGRLWGIWGQFLASASLMIFLWFYVSTFFKDTDNFQGIFWMISSVVTLPMIGLRNSLHSSGYVQSFLLTVLLGQLVPGLIWLLPLLLNGIAWTAGLGGPIFPEESSVSFVAAMFVQYFMAYAMLGQLRKSLLHRRFLLRPQLA